jgi:hypothetical protein
MSKLALGADVVASLTADFAAHGPAVIAQVRQSDPANYLTFVARILPKDLQLATAQDRGDLSPEDWRIFIEVLRALKASIPNVDDMQPGKVFHFLVAAIAAYKPRRLEHKKTKNAIRTTQKQEIS